MLGLTPSSLAISETVFEPRAIRRRTASFLNESGRFFLCCIGGTPTRVIPSGMSTKAGQAHDAAGSDGQISVMQRLNLLQVVHQRQAQVGWEQGHAVLSAFALANQDLR